MDEHHHNLSPTPPPSHSPCATITSVDEPTLNFNVTVIVAAMLCALVCAIGLHSVLQCVVRCTRRAFIEPVEWVSSRRLNSGLNKKDMVALPTSTYVKSDSPPSTSRCAICLTDFSDGDKLRVLPKCNHRFHVGCIDTWLLSHSSCPTCRYRLKSRDDPITSLEIATQV